MEFLVPNYRCLQNPWLGGYRTPDPRSVLCPQLNLLNPPPEKIPGYATDKVDIFYGSRDRPACCNYNAFTCIMDVCFESRLDHRLPWGQGYSNLGRQVAVATDLFKWHLRFVSPWLRMSLHVTLLAPNNSRWLLNFYRTCVSLPDGFLGVSHSNHSNAGMLPWSSRDRYLSNCF